MRADRLLFGLALTDRQMVVGDVITHAEHGEGTLRDGWEGHLQVDFPSGTVSFSDHDDVCLIASPQSHHWQLVARVEVDAYLAEFQKRRQDAITRVRAVFATNFLGADDLFNQTPSEHLTLKEYEEEKVRFVQRWMEEHMPSQGSKPSPIPDEEQALAIATVGCHVQVSARAGSGKTETIANRAAFLQRHCDIAPAEMMLLAFNRDAAREMAKRLEAKLGGASLPYVMTFHALAYALVSGATTLLVNATDGSDQSLNEEFQQVLLDAMQHPKFELRVRRLMLAHFRADWDSIIRGGLHLDRDEMLAFRRGLVSETLRGDFVKSFGEKVIANFLFEHDVPYEYERSHWASGRNYRPDFTLPKAGKMSRGIVIEYFGLKGDPDYDEVSAKKRSYWEKKVDAWIFIEVSPSVWRGDQVALERILVTQLTEGGMTLCRLSEDEIWERARQRSILRFNSAVSGFVGRSRKQWLEPDDLRDRALTHDFSVEIEQWFVELATELYELYLQRLAATKKDDFDGLLQKAVTSVASGATSFSRKAGDGDLRRLRFLFIDEFQDFSELFHRLVEAIRAVNPGAQIFCVGDDWQAINRFSGRLTALRETRRMQ